MIQSLTYSHNHGLISQYIHTGMSVFSHTGIGKYRWQALGWQVITGAFRKNNNEVKGVKYDLGPPQGFVMSREFSKKLTRPKFFHT